MCSKTICRSTVNISTYKNDDKAAFTSANKISVVRIHDDEAVAAAIDYAMT